jgi:hypothetical protein
MESTAKVIQTHRLIGQADSRRVWLDGKELKPGRSQKLRTHSPDGFEWGYGGSGPAQRALAVMLEVLGDEETALQLYQAFKWETIAGLPLGKDFDIEFAI